MDNNKNTIAIASDHAGYELKEEVKNFLETKGFVVHDLGTCDKTSCHYPVFAKKVAEEVQSKKAERGILVCGTGQGMAMVANKFRGIRAAVCSDTFSAKASRAHNNANILCLGQRVVGTGLALDITECWLNSVYEGGRHQIRLEMFEN